MENRFDTLAKSLAESVSRRQALSRLGGGVAGMLLAAAGLDRAWGKDNGCGSRCQAATGFQANSPPKITAAYKACVSDCDACKNAGRNPCFATGGTVACCSSGQNCSTATNCAACCSSGQSCCNNVCVNLNTDTNNCGTCGHVCPSPAHAMGYCQNGACGITCNAGFGDCNNIASDGCEVDLTTTSDCGICGNGCSAPQNGTPVCTNATCDFTCNSGFNRNGDTCVAATCVADGQPCDLPNPGACCSLACCNFNPPAHPVCCSI
jgi:hypothetical protein